MQEILISIQPYFVYHIIAEAMGWKTEEKIFEVRKTYPKSKEWNRTVHIYCSRSRKSFKRIPKEYQPCMERYLGKVVGEFSCDKINVFACDSSVQRKLAKYGSCLTEEELRNYHNGQALYGWHISELKIYGKLRKLTDYLKPCIWSECPYCPDCPVGYEYISESEAEAFRIDGECDTKWYCLNRVKRPPQSWCYVDGYSLPIS